MEDDDEQFDEELARLAASLRGGDHMMACLLLAEFALKLDLCIRREERVLALAYAQVAHAKVRGEHASLRRLVALIAAALDRADDRAALETIAALRSVFLLHVTKAERLLSAAAFDQRTKASSSL